MNNPTVAIINYELGNLFSVKHACETNNLRAFITSSKNEILAADLVILPGVGAFGDAMDNLRKYDLIDTLHTYVTSGKPLVGICLGLQLFMSRSTEFGMYDGLGLIDGEVVKFPPQTDGTGRRLKVPQVGWNTIMAPRKAPDKWNNTPLKGVPENEFMYFVHSFYVKPEGKEVILSESEYGDIRFCSSINYKNIFGCQFHPERSGEKGLHIYDNLFTMVTKHL